MQIPVTITAQLAPGLQLLTPTLPTMYVGQPYSFQLLVTGGVAPYKFFLSQIAGMPVSQTGLVAGVPSGTAGSLSASGNIEDANGP